MIYEQICAAKSKGQKLLSILIDPDHLTLESLPDLVASINESPATHIMMGGSLIQKNEMDELIATLKKLTKLPVILFPGNYAQLSNQADGILFLSLISGRNPEYLIGQHIHAAPLIKQTNLEVLPTGYVLIDSGAPTSVSYISNTQPIPRNKKDIALATALAGEMLGLKMIYLEAGSGAQFPVPISTIQLVSSQLKIPIIVGGGMRTPETIQEAYDAGADMVVVGTAFEKNIHFFKK
jgi:putative glycerol-1-phosphate prenyltransferase